MKTKRHPRGLAVLSLTGMLALGTALAQQPQGAETELEKEAASPVSAELSIDVLSDYMWRGTTCNANPVWQPSATLGYDLGDMGALAVNVWSSFDLTHKRGSATNSRRAAGLQEIDYTASYSVDLFGFGLEVGHVWYTFPANTDVSQLLRAKAA